MDATIGCFGKLPFHREFIRIEASGPEVTALDEFFQNGLQHARQTGGATFEQSYLQQTTPFGFFWRPEATGRLLAGLARPSHDSIGRLFPFAIFASLGGNLDFPTMPLAMKSFLEEVAGLLSKKWQEIGEVTADVARLRDCAFTETPAWESHLRQIPMAQHPSAASHVPYLLFYNLGAVANTLIGVRDARLTYGLGFPLMAGRESLMPSLSFAVGLAMKGLPSAGSPTALFWRMGEEPLGILFLGRPSPHIFHVLIRPEDSEDDIFWLHRDGAVAPEKVRAALPKELVRVLDSPQATLAGILRAF